MMTPAVTASSSSTSSFKCMSTGAGHRMFVCTFGQLSMRASGLIVGVSDMSALIYHIMII